MKEYRQGHTDNTNTIEKALVSIITPSYNCGRFIGETIESVKAQTYENWEMIIVDDQSEDNTLSVLMPFLEDKRIHVYQNTEHKGAGESRNAALKAAKGKWIAFLDSDDVWEPTKLERQIAFMVENGYHFSCHNYVEMDVNGKETGVMVSSKKHISKWDLYTCCWPGCLTVMYDADYVGLVQIRNIKTNNDTAMWLKVAKKADCYLLDESLARYRRRKNSITHRGKIKRILGHYNLFRYAQRMNPIAAVFLMFVNICGNAYKKIRYVKTYQPE